MKDILSRNEYRKGLSPTESRVLSDLVFHGKSMFTAEDLAPYGIDTKRFLSRLRNKGWIAWVKRGLYLIAPLEAGKDGAKSHTIHSFVLASHLAEPCYVGFWSALSYHGMTEATPPVVYLASTVHQNSRIIFDVRVVFVTLRPWKMFGTEIVRIEGSEVTVSDREKTVVDCVDHPEHCGGIVQIRDVLEDEFESVDYGRVLRYARRMRNTTVLKRLGYLLDTLGYHDEAGRIPRASIGQGYSKLDPRFPNAGPTNERWRLRVNVRLGSVEGQG